MYDCYTFIVEHEEEEWPTEFERPPVVGDYVKSLLGVKLTVLTVTHMSYRGHMSGVTQPLCELELGIEGL